VTAVLAAAHAGHDVMPPWVALVVYAAGFVITTRRFFITSDGEDRDGDRFGAVCVGLIWPIIFAYLAVWALLALPTLGAKTRLDRRVRAQAAGREHHNLAARIAELEAENDRLREAP
jgi:hypothetical protein